MEPDPAIEQVREVRHRISARFDHDPERLVRYYMELQRTFRGRIIKVSGIPAPDDDSQRSDRVAEKPPHEGRSPE
jgi:hypothetical protein